MRGQALVLVGLILVAALAVAMMAFYALQSSASLAPSKPSYGYISRSWPDLVKLAGGYLTYVASQSVFALARGSLDVGLYGRPYDGRWLQYNETARRARLGLLTMSAALASLQVNATGGLWYYIRGFNGSLGPYPLAATYSNWNLDVVRTGVAIPCGSDTLYIRLVPLNAKAARFVVQSQVDVGVPYVLTYLGHTSDIVTVGAGYNEILSDMLRMGNPNGKLALYAFDSSVLGPNLCYKTDDQIAQVVRSGIKPLPWYAEVFTCPFCMLHFQVPPGFLQKGRTSEVLITYTTSGSISAPQFKVVISRRAGYSEIPIYVNAYTTSDPRAVFPAYFGARDIATWQSAVVATDGDCYPAPQGGVVDYGVAVTTNYLPPGTTISRSVRIYATYAPNTQRYGFNVFTSYSWPYSDVGYKVEALVLPEDVSYIRPARLDIYASDPSSTHPICASMYAVQVVNPVLVWSWWNIGGGYVWNGRTWDVGYVVYSGRQWYLMSFALSPSGIAQWAVYHYNSTGRPMRLLGVTTRSGVTWLQNFYIVLGSAIVDNPGSTSSYWTEAAYYAYVRVRPWVYPEPTVSLSGLDTPPLVQPQRNDIVALNRSEVRLRLDSTLDMAGAFVRRMNATLWVNASAAVQKSGGVTLTHERTLWYLVNVSHSEPRAALSSQFYLYYVLGNAVRNYTIQNVALYDYGDRWARFNVTFTVPRRAPYAVLISVAGSVVAKLAVSNAAPRVYYLNIPNNDGTYTYYVMNYGNLTAVFYLPWGTVTSFDDSWNPQALGYSGYFGALYDVTNGRDRWQVLAIPPGGLVKFKTSSSVDLKAASPSWQQPYVQDLYPQLLRWCELEKIYKIYRFLVPTNITTSYYIFTIDGYLPRSLSGIYIFGPFTPGWVSVPYYIERDPRGNKLPRIWVRVDAPPGKLDYSGMLAVLCSQGPGESSKDVVFGTGYWGTGTSYADISQLANLLTFPDGYTVDIKPLVQSSIVGSWGLSNSTYLPSVWPCSADQTHVAIYYVGGSPPYWWHFDGFCFDRHIWEKQGYTPYLASISISRQFVLYRMWDMSFSYDGMWRRSYPNKPVNSNSPYVAYSYVVSDFGFEWRIRPFAWPEPYVRE
ncbi:hypothetical protein [Pyrobaculum neutrophilum]|uniref:Uncharacterized protein n=1 Tax=Pyrobaculum neutrophilum (strain DSM 2338 / JCM 9278 / NBRC 100436 / V24Sta) TaxID=444157 RepID=B1YA99_PYRNV|nr:hypothetical protein [Pyrobaculum neutrophilum]ACB39073.1 conserved hypothetical protein [Pyrobaculum neutrophilum V24Sta]